MSRQRKERAPFTVRLAELRSAWHQYKVQALRSVLLILLAAMLVAQFSPLFGDFLIKNRFLSFALIIAVVFALFDAVVTHDPIVKQQDYSVVLKHFTDLRKHLREAFESQIIELNVASYSGETFYSVLSEFLQDVIEGRRKPKRIHLKLLVPDCTAPMAVPCLLDSLAEDKDYKASIQARNKRFAGEFQNYFNEINRRSPSIDAQFEVKMHKLAPLFKMIIINNEKGFISFYPIAETGVTIEGRLKNLWDFRGERAHYVGMAADGAAAERELFMRLSDWFKTVWFNLSTNMQGV